MSRAAAKVRTAMPEPLPHQEDRPQGDPWHAFGYLTAGIFIYGAIGWGLDRWLGTSFLVVIGILVGAALGLYLTWTRFRPDAAGRRTT